MTTRWICQECGWIGHDADILRAPNPFDPGDIIVGCPGCKSVDTIIAACDEPGCTRPVNVGTPTPDGYRHTCHQHAPQWPQPPSAAFAYFAE